MLKDLQTLDDYYDYLSNQRMIVVDYLRDSYCGGYTIKAINLDPSSETPYTAHDCSVPEDYDIGLGAIGTFVPKYEHRRKFEVAARDLIWKPMPSDEHTSEIYSIVGVFDVFQDGAIEVYGRNIGQKRIHLKGLTSNTKVGHMLLLRSLKQARDKYEFVHNITMAKLRHDIDRGKYV